MPNVISIDYGRNREPLQRRTTQVAVHAPLKPVREQILDLILEQEWTFQEIAVKSRTNLATVYAVNAAYMQQYMRQAKALRLEADEGMIQRYREVRDEVWSEFSLARKVAA